MGLKVLVTGGSGFLGSHIADELTRAGHAVTILDATPSPWLGPDQRMIVADILDENAVRRAVSGCQAVYHIAGVADIGKAAKNPLETVRVNVLGTTTLLEACVEAKVQRLLFASTIYVYSQQGSFYRASKQASESLIEAYQERFGLDYTILRYGSLYGPRAQDWNGLRRYVSQAIFDHRIEYHGSGEELREYIHVLDAARLSVQALEAEHRNSCLILTGSQVLHSRELLHMIEEIVGKKVEVVFLPETRDRDHYVTTPYRYNPKPARKMVPGVFVPIGQGILDLAEELDRSRQSSGSP
ncbi:MAG: NAD(P)-dependent oxidoreductase [Magnetococcales bacterium]|nr:NAD(P)-dependent oxidoreductase [Magnetococcales bacterium]